MSEKTLKIIDNDRLIILVVSSLKNAILNFFSAKIYAGLSPRFPSNFPQEFL